jgi:hypothetical protein
MPASRREWCEPHAVTPGVETRRWLQFGATQLLLIVAQAHRDR